MGDLEYLGRGLNTRTYASVEAYKLAASKIKREATLHGAQGSSRVLVAFGEAAIEEFTKEALEAAQFAFNVMDHNGEEVSKPLEYALGRMVDMIGNALGGENGSPDHASITNKAKAQLKAKKEQILDDFVHGIMGSHKLKKDSVISVVNNQTNSPGSTQQVGFGNFSQTAFTQQQHALVRAIDAALASQEYAALGPPQKEAFKDIADTLKDEAAKPAPDSGKLKRWGSRLVDLANEIGLKVASDTLTKVLTDIFTGG